MKYLNWDEQIAPPDASAADIAHMYEHGYVFTRIGKGVMHQTRSVRIDLSKFELSSENRRILKKIEGMEIDPTSLSFADYDWSIGKMAKDFYEIKFGRGIMSAQKIKELLTDLAASNFNLLMRYTTYGITPIQGTSSPLGYAICYENKELLHYSYPFYDLKSAAKDMGLGMMIMAIQWAKQTGKKYAYLGSLQRPGDTYKLQFTGLEWFDGGPGGTGKWRTDTEPLKALLKADV